jgi:alpha-tubulin suppressor-like RCC1 family protein
VALPGAAPAAQIAQTFVAPAAANIVFVDFFAKPVAEADLAAATTFDIEAARFAFSRNASGKAELFGFNGDGAGGGTFVTTGFATAANADGTLPDWVRLTVRLDFTNKHWDLYANGKMVAADLNFRDNTRTQFTALAVRGHATAISRIDYLFADVVNPLFVDADKDGMEDAWEVANGLNPAIDDRNGDKDGDGLTNIREYVLGTRADLADTDGDGLSDSFEVAHGTNPLVSDATVDTDGDGVSDALELLNGTDPKDYYNGVAPALGYSGLATQISRKGLVGPWEIATVVTNATTGAPLRNAPVTFAVASSIGTLLANLTDSAGSALLIVRTDTNGIARAQLKLNTGLAVPVTAFARAYIGVAVVRELAFKVLPVVESTELALGTDQSLWVDDNGVGRAWGRNALGQLGDGTVAARSQMRRLASLTDPLKSTAYGHAHGLATNATGQVAVWGDDYLGQLGDGRTTNRRVPAWLSNLSGVVQVAAGDSHSLALRADGTVWAWGANQSGQLGDGTTVNRATPVQITGVSNIVRLVAGARHSAALAADGTVWVWGSNEFGQLGTNAVSDRATPLAVPGVTGVVTIVSGRQYLLALRYDGTVLAWGDNHAGQLGLGNTRSQAAPQSITSLPISAGITAGSNHSLALGADGVLRAWGANDVGQLGTGNTTASLAPVALAVANIRAFAAGADHVVVLKTDGSLQAWGLNADGQLGAVANGFSSSPVTVAPPVD